MFVISFTCLIYSNMSSVYYLSSIYIYLLFTSLIINQLILQISIPSWHARSFLSPLLIPKSVSFWMVRHILLFNWLRRGDLNWNFSLVCTHIICLHGQQHDYLRDYLYIYIIHFNFNELTFWFWSSINTCLHDLPTWLPAWLLLVYNCLCIAVCIHRIKRRYLISTY